MSILKITVNSNAFTTDIFLGCEEREVGRPLELLENCFGVDLSKHRNESVMSDTSWSFTLTCFKVDRLLASKILMPDMDAIVI